MSKEILKKALQLCNENRKYYASLVSDKPFEIQDNDWINIAKDTLRECVEHYNDETLIGRGNRCLHTMNY